jgi:3-oxoacyl-[acyl-carrier protein] reductase
MPGQAAIVTGGGTGIGRGIVLAYAREGASVVVNYSKSRDASEKTAAEARAAGGKAVAVQADVSQEDQAIRLVERAVTEFGRLDVLVNNAGWTRPIPHDNLAALTEEVWKNTFGVNLMGTFYCIRAAVPIMKTQGGGCIINVASTAAFTGMGSSVVYCASKAGVVAMSKSLARALAPHVRVNVIAPGYVDTAFLPRTEEEKEKGRRGVHTIRATQPEDIGKMAVFLAADAPVFTGQVMFADGATTTLGRKA